MNEAEEDHLLTSLKVISMIKEGQKVCVRNGNLSLEVQSTGLVTSLRRWINRDSRQSTIFYIKSVIQNSISLARAPHVHETTVSKLVSGMREALVGVSSLIVTYSDDATITATLQVLRDRIMSELATSF